MALQALQAYGTRACKRCIDYWCLSVVVVCISPTQASRLAVSLFFWCLVPASPLYTLRSLGCSSSITTAADREFVNGSPKRERGDGVVARQRIQSFVSISSSYTPHSVPSSRYLDHLRHQQRSFRARNASVPLQLQHPLSSA